MHYSRHRLTASVAYVAALTYASTNDQWARCHKLKHVTSVQLRCPVRAFKNVGASKILVQLCFETKKLFEITFSLLCCSIFTIPVPTGTMFL